jgi:hypothetical protein
VYKEVRLTIERMVGKLKCLPILVPSVSLLLKPCNLSKNGIFGIVSERLLCPLVEKSDHLEREIPHQSPALFVP